MKRIIALILAALMLAATLASCAVAPSASINPKIRLTSSDAESAAAWLAERLGDKLTDRLAVGTDAEAYGLDLSALEDDGYIIRDLGGETALFARTADGLDRAVRRYAKSVEAGESLADVAFHEGERIKRIEIAGRDISEYTVYAGDEGKLLAAANDLSSLICRACGVTLPVTTGEPVAPCITLGYVHDESLGNVGYTWEITGDGLALGFSDLYAPTSPAVGVRRYLEKALDWFGLSYGYEDLTAADLISLEAGERGSDACDFHYVSFYGDFCAAPDVFPNSFPSYSNIIHACHGILSLKLAGDLSKTPDTPWLFDEPCWLDEDFYEYSLEDLTDYIEQRIAAGAVPGESLRIIDVAQSDNAGWCTCKKCTALYLAEGKTHAAEVLTWANRISEELSETYPGIYYGVFAYWETKKPPKTIVPNDHLFITYCFDCNCSLHAIDGSKCDSGEPSQGGKLHAEHDNKTVSYYYEQWEKLTDKLYAWYYGIGNGLLTVSYIHTVRDNLRYLRDHGARGLFWEAEDEGYNTGKAAKWLTYLLAWDVDMSDGEYDALFDRVLRVLYGDAAPFVKEYIDVETRLYANTACATCWGWGEVHDSLAPALWRDAYDYLFDLIEKARSLADSDMQEYRMTRLSCECIYKGSFASYYDAVAAGDEARVAELCRRYALIDERLTARGTDMTAIRPFAGADAVMYERDLETQAKKTSWLAFFGLVDAAD